MNNKTNSLNIREVFSQNLKHNKKEAPKVNLAYPRFLKTSL